MRYIKNFYQIQEASKSANDYKFRRDILPYEIEDILIPLKDEFISYIIRYPRIDLKRIEIDMETTLYDKRIDKKSIEDILSHLIYYLKSENFNISYINTHGAGDKFNINGFDITSPVSEITFNKIFELLPDNFEEIYLHFTTD
jgi:hypothetical protein